MSDFVVNSSSYPLSLVASRQLVATDGVITAEININLNMVDVELVKRYGPVYVDVGGIFGTSPFFVSIDASTALVRDGAIIKQAFVLDDSSDDDSKTAKEADAAQDWIATMYQRVSDELQTIRTQDQETNLGTDTITPV